MNSVQSENQWRAFPLMQCAISVNHNALHHMKWWICHTPPNMWVGHLKLVYGTLFSEVIMLCVSHNKSICHKFKVAFEALITLTYRQPVSITQPDIKAYHRKPSVNTFFHIKKLIYLNLKIIVQKNTRNVPLGKTLHMLTFTHMHIHTYWDIFDPTIQPCLPSE